MTLIDLQWHGKELAPDVLRRRGLRGAVAAEVGLAVGSADAETNGRTALRALVDAFLGDRAANADLFKRAHALGRRISETVRCRYTPGEDFYSLSCPIFGLHRMVAHSIEATVTTACSICGAGTLGCEHVPGGEYEGETCVTSVLALGLGDIAFTAEPDFIYTWHQPHSFPTDQLILDGVIQQLGDEAFCTHCRECDGSPTKGDLDPVARFSQLVQQNSGANDQGTAKKPEGC